MDARLEARHPTLDEMIASTLAQLNLLNSSELNARQQQLVATHLLSRIKSLNLNIATPILFRATQHSIFQDEEVRSLIATAFGKINYERLPEHSTVASIKYYEKTHAHAVTDLLTNPELLLAWLEQASALEIGELFETYFSNKGDNYLAIRKLAEQEYLSNSPGKAMLCYALMLPTFPDKDAIPHIEQAIESLVNFKRCAKSASIKIYTERVMIEKSIGCFINLSRVNLNEANYAELNLTGAFINRASLCRVNLTKACLFHARLNGSTLTSAILSHANLKYAKLCGAKLVDTIFDYADLYEADLSNADLTRANLCRANLQLANFGGTTLTGAMFFMSSDFQHIDLLKSELNRLEKMLADHQFLGVLQEAIANDLINNIRASVSRELIEPLLQTALAHPLFTQHQHYHYLKETANVVTSFYNAASTRLFSLMGNTTQKTEEAKPTHVTKALKLLREELTRQTKPVSAITERQQRPPPPNVPPAAPTLHH